MVNTQVRTTSFNILAESHNIYIHILVWVIMDTVGFLFLTLMLYSLLEMLPVCMP